MEYHVLYVESRKSLKDKKEKKYFFAECEKNTRQTCFFAECKKTVGKFASLPSVFILPCGFLVALGKELVCRVPEGLHLANYLALDKDGISHVLPQGVCKHFGGLLYS